MYPVDPTRLDLAREFRQRPLGPHSPDLQRLLKVLRWDSVTDRFIVVQRIRGGPWSVARATGPKGHPIEFFDEGRYATSQDAWWEIFRRRWRRHTGELLELPEDASDRTPLVEVGQLETSASRYPILGYADEFSVRPGGSIAFKISATSDYRVTIERLRCGDHAGVGFKSTPVPSAVDGVKSGRLQEATCRSWIEIPEARSSFELSSFTLSARIWPTTPALGRWQALLGNGSVAERLGFLLGIDAGGCLVVRLSDGSGNVFELSTGRPLLERHWYLAVASFDGQTGELRACQYAAAPVPRPRRQHRGCAPDDVAAACRWPRFPHCRGVRCAAPQRRGRAFRRPEAPYNGKIDGPTVLSRPVSAEEREAALAGGARPGGDSGSDPATVAAWSFGQEIPTIRVVDPSGLYAARLSPAAGEGQDDDWIPFVVSPSVGRAEAPLALLLPSASYWAYANTQNNVSRITLNVVRRFIDPTPFDALP